jgi:hypothetical protein
LDLVWIDRKQIKNKNRFWNALWGWEREAMNSKHLFEDNYERHLNKF